MGRNHISLLLKLCGLNASKFLDCFIGVSHLYKRATLRVFKCSQLSVTTLLKKETQTGSPKEVSWSSPLHKNYSEALPSHFVYLGMFLALGAFGSPGISENYICFYFKNISRGWENIGFVRAAGWIILCACVTSAPVFITP